MDLKPGSISQKLCSTRRGHGGLHRIPRGLILATLSNREQTSREGLYLFFLRPLRPTTTFAAAEDDKRQENSTAQIFDIPGHNNTAISSTNNQMQAICQSAVIQLRHTI
jgi:hypothetical protein